MSKLLASFNNVDKQSQLDWSVAPVWLTPPTRGPPISTSVAMATIIDDAPFMVCSSLVPES